MAQNLTVRYEGKPCYDILIRDSFKELAKSIDSMNEMKYGRACVVTDSHVAPLYRQEVQHLLQGHFSVVTSFVFPAGEQSKNLETVQDLYEQLIRDHFDRGDLLVALGGGVVGDLCGFAAATYLRGIDFVQVPTTLLAQVDSSVGGKTGVDFRGYKNMVGAFKMPCLVYMNVSALSSLPEEQFISGMGEVVKHGLIRSAEYYHWLQKNHDQIMQRDPETLEEMVAVSAKIKRDTVEKDPKEHGIRSHLNFGHTIGHAVEKLSDFRLFHGQCVGLGMVSALELSVRQGYISQQDADEAIDTIASFGLPTSIQMADYPGMTPENVLSTTKSDKKMSHGKVKFVVLKAIGEADTYMDFTDEDLLWAIGQILK